MKKHINIPIFIPHLGCPNQCVFCNQRTISGVLDFECESVREIIENSLKTAGDREVEIAFFGGSFTGIDRELMISLLKIAKEYIDRGLVSSVRCSTRPDYISPEILDILKEYGVKTIELGLQSVSDGVLSLTKRGHTFDDEARAARLITDSGFALGGQMMIGLPGSTPEDELRTAEFIAKSGATEARIYPTLVFRDTELCEMAERGEYTPLSLDEAVIRSALSFAVFVRSGIRVLRIGLCESENLHSDRTYFAGPNHPAIGELVEGEYYFNLISERLNVGNYSGKCIKIICPIGHKSKIIGQKRKNIVRLTEKFGIKKISVDEGKQIAPYGILIIEERSALCT